MQDISHGIVRRFASGWLQLLWCVWLTASAPGQSATRSEATTNAGNADRSSPTAKMAKPKPQGANPFLPSIDRDVRLPVILGGYCVVSLRERQAWLPGQEANQLVFDGHLYWFVSQRERAMFATAPRRYVPAFGGNCIVTFADDETRQRGDPQYGILHDGRLFFFRGLSEREKFQTNPDHYAKLDLANDGFCLVSQIDEQRRLPGLVETTVIVDGLRYRFAGLHQQQKFLTNMTQYHGTPPATQLPHSRIEGQDGSPPSLLTPEDLSNSSSVQKQGDSDPTSLAEVTNKAMGGYCPVSIRDAGVWVSGDLRYRVEFDGLTYLLAGEIEMNRFSDNPTPYLPALGGFCVVTEIDENRRVPGSIYHASQYEGRLYLFAGADQKQVFDTTTPEKYAGADLVADGNCIVSFIDEGEQVAGLPELLIWHQGKRYLFASVAHQATFRENIQRYQAR